MPKDSAGGSGYEIGFSWPESRSHQVLLTPVPSVQTSYLGTQTHLSYLCLKFIVKVLEEKENDGGGGRAITAKDTF